MRGIFRVAGHEVYQIVSLDCIKTREHICKIKSVPLVLSVGVDVLPRRYVLRSCPYKDSTSSKTAGFLYAFPAPDVRDNAIGTKIICGTLWKHTLW